MILSVILILVFTFYPAWLLTMLIWKIVYGSVLEDDEETGRRRIMIGTYLVLNTILLTLYFTSDGSFAIF